MPASLDMNTSACREKMVLAVDFHENFTVQNVEELLSLLVMVPNLG